MAQIHYRANLSAATFPMTVAQAGRSVIIPGPDQNFDRRVDAPGETNSRSVGIPQAVYMENVFPTDEGYKSVGFQRLGTITPPAGATLIDVIRFPITSVSPSGATVISQLYFAFFSNNTVQKSNNLDVWQAQNVVMPVGWINSKVSVAIVKNKIYLCAPFLTVSTKFYRVDIGLYNTGTASVTTNVVDVSAAINGSLPPGINNGDIKGIIGSFNYLIVITRFAVYWSSTTTPTDFSPSLVSGAGNELPNNLAGAITFAKSYVHGFYIFTAKNCILALYTGNARYPWKFKEVQNSGGFNSEEQIAGSTNDIVFFGVDNSRNFHALAEESSQLVLSELTNFLLNADYYDAFDQVTNTFSLVSYSPLNQINTWYVLDRYVIVTYALDAFNSTNTRAIVYDRLLKRAGTLKGDFSIVLDDGVNVYFISQISNQIFKLQFSQEIADVNYKHESVLILGKFQYARSRFISLEEYEIENVSDDVAATTAKYFNTCVIPTLNGKDLLPAVIPYNNSSPNSSLVQLLCHVHCKNFLIGLKGYFNLNTLALVVQVEGDN